MAKRKLAGLRILVTGASQGIGRALAVEAAKRGSKVIAVARSAELLGELVSEIRSAGGTVEIVLGDVTSAEDRQAMIDGAVKHFGGLDVLVNNAGIGATGHFTDSQPDVIRRIFEVNYFGLIELIRLALPVLRQGTTPAIVNISSIVGRRGLPGRSVYASSKFALAGFSEALRAELAPEGIGLLVVNPGLTQTNFPKNLLESNARRSLDHMRGMTPETVAKATYNALESGWNEISLTFLGKLLVLMARLTPGLVDFFAKRAVRKLFADEITAREARREEAMAAKSK